MTTCWTCPSAALANEPIDVDEISIKRLHMNPSLRSYELRPFELRDFEYVHFLHLIFTKKICSSFFSFLVQRNYSRAETSSTSHVTCGYQ